jgi:GDP-L-fucose synthase
MPRRDFLHVDDLADAAVFLLRNYSGDLPVNIGTGLDVSVLELAELLADVIEWRGRFDFDLSKPDGSPRKVLDTSVLKTLGWTAGTPLRDGLTATYHWYRRAGNVRGGGQVSR